MFICLELETEDITLWQRVDEALAKEFGFTHVIWGVNKEKENKPVACKLPSNLYNAEVTCKANELSKRIQEIINEFKITYNLMVMEDNGWSHKDNEFKAPQSSISSGSIDEMESRQE